MRYIKFYACTKPLIYGAVKKAHNMTTGRSGVCHLPWTTNWAEASSESKSVAATQVYFPVSNSMVPDIVKELSIKF